MPREGKTTVTVDEETFEHLRECKPNSKSWDTFLLQRCLSLDDPVDPPSADVTHRSQMGSESLITTDRMGADVTRDMTVQWNHDPSDGVFWPEVSITGETETESVELMLSFGSADHLRDFARKLLHHSDTGFPGEFDRPEQYEPDDRVDLMWNKAAVHGMLKARNLPPRVKERAVSVVTYAHNQQKAKGSQLDIIGAAAEYAAWGGLDEDVTQKEVADAWGVSTSSVARMYDSIS